MSTDQFFLNQLRRVTTAKVWGEQYELFDFYTSSTIGMIEQDIEKDLYDVRKLAGPRYILDLGANIGLWSFSVARYFQDALVFGIDVAPWNCTNMKANAETNKIPNVKVYECGLGKPGEKKTFFQHPLNSGGCSIRNPEYFPSLTVDTHSLDELIEKLDVPVFDFVKVDLEGSEYEVLYDFKGWNRIKRMGIELHGYQDERQETEAEMEKLIEHIGMNMGYSNFCAVSYRKTYKYGETLDWGIVQAREEDILKQAKKAATEKRSEGT